MAKLEKSPKSGFVIKLSSQTVQKISEEEQQAKQRTREETHAKTETPSNATDTKETMPPNVVKVPEQDANIVVKKDVNKSVLSQDKSSELASSADKSNTLNEKDKANPNWGEYAPYISYEGEEAIYTDPNTQHKYTWDQTTNQWVTKPGQAEVPGRVYSYENDEHVYTEADGSKCFWDVDKKAWIPKVDDDFLAYYQMSYGFVDNTKTEEDPKEKEENRKKEAIKKIDAAAGKRKAEPQWFEPSQDSNTKVYVSNLPLDLTEEEFVDFMQKCGLVERDPTTQKMKVKLYMDKEQNCFKGDALCTYIKIESVDLALKLLDGGDLKGNKVKVEKAHFQLKGEYNPALKPKKKKKKELEKLKKMQQKLFDWRPEKLVGERSKHERIVIVKNLFHPSDFDKDVQLILDYQQDLREECSKSGEVRKVVIYDRHPEGVAQITMKEPEQADAVIQLISGRWFGKRQITAEIWDGRTKYRIAETDADINKRIDKWDKFLDGKEDESKKDVGSSSEATVSSQESTTPIATTALMDEEKIETTE